MKKNVLIVEDDLKLARYIELELKHEGFQTYSVADGKMGLDESLTGKYDLIILDIMLPIMNGMEICRRIRQSLDVPIIMLTARGDTMDKIAGLDFGADDYVTKPFEIEEFLARVRRFFRKKTSNSNQLSSEKLQINLDSHTCQYGEAIINLSKTEFDLCVYLMENRERVLTREQILENVWGFDYYGETRVVDVYIRYLREKIDDKFNKHFFQTVRGVGYIFKDKGE
ncbi:MAG: response regulator transcription factor [Clostridia bacterium]|nr:response regulator transcription factor [Clostridia bacterium]